MFKYLHELKNGERGYTSAARLMQIGESLFIESTAAIHEKSPGTNYIGIIKDTDRCYIWFDDPNQKARIQDFGTIRDSFTVTVIRCFYTSNPNICMQ